MNKLLLVAIAFTMAFTSNAQIKTPSPSPNAKLEQVVGLTDVTISYSRPAMRGRIIFGDLVPYGRIWRTGANERTKVTFSNEVTIAENVLKAGTYSIFTIPQLNEWEVIFYSEHEGYEAPKELDESKVAAIVKVKTESIPKTIQSLTISIDDVTNGSAVIGIFWENIYVGVAFEVSTDKVVMAAIEKTLDGPGTRDYFLAATYYYKEGKDLAKAKKWIDKALSLVESPRYWELRQQALIYAAVGNKKSAIAIAKASLAASEKAGDEDYIKMNKKSLTEWAQ